MGWHLGTLPALCAAAAVLELDAVHAGQFMVSRPVVAGPLLGWAAGAPEAGIRLGLLFEALTVDDLPVGGYVPINGTVAVTAAVLLSARSPALAAAAIAAGLLLGSLFRRVDALLRAVNARWARSAEAALQAGRPVPFPRLAAFSMAAHAAALAAFLYAGLAVLDPVLAFALAWAPEAARRGLALADEAVWFLGVAGLLHAFRTR